MQTAMQACQSIKIDPTRGPHKHKHTAAFGMHASKSRMCQMADGLCQAAKVSTCSCSTLVSDAQPRKIMHRVQGRCCVTPSETLCQSTIMAIPLPYFARQTTTQLTTYMFQTDIAESISSDYVQCTTWRPHSTNVGS